MTPNSSVECLLSRVLDESCGSCAGHGASFLAVAAFRRSSVVAPATDQRVIFDLGVTEQLVLDRVQHSVYSTVANSRHVDAHVYVLIKSRRS